MSGGLRVVAASHGLTDADRLALCDACNGLLGRFDVVSDDASKSTKVWRRQTLDPFFTHAVASIARLVDAGFLTLLAVDIAQPTPRGRRLASELRRRRLVVRAAAQSRLTAHRNQPAEVSRA